MAVTYSAPTTPEGALVGNADVNGVFVGSLIYANPSSSLNFNAGGKVLRGNIYFPGTPKILVENNIEVVAAGAAYVERGLIPRPASSSGSGIAGKQFASDGSEVTPATDTRQIVDLTGATTPNNYTVRFNKGVYVEGKVFRRSDPPPFPTVTVPTGLTSRGSVTMNSGAGIRTLLPGSYSSVTVNGGTGIRLGSAGSTATQQYVFNSLNLNGDSRIYVDSPVELYVPNGFNVNSSICGNVDHPEWLTIKVVSNGVQMNSGSTLYGQIVAPTSTVGVDGTFNGSVVAQTLRINGQGVVFSTPPVIGGED